MTHFKEAQLAELLTHLGEPSEALPDVTASPRRRRTALRVGALATTAAAALAVTFSVVDLSSPTPAYALTKNGNGTYTLTLNEMVDAAKVTKDLHAAGLRVDVIKTDHGPKPCPPSSPAEQRRQAAVGKKWEEKELALNRQVRGVRVSADWKRVTIDPGGIPLGGVMYLRQHPAPKGWPGTVPTLALMVYPVGPLPCGGLTMMFKAWRLGHVTPEDGGPGPLFAKPLPNSSSKDLPGH